MYLCYVLHVLGAMPYRYKRKTNHRSTWTEESLRNAISAVRNGKSVNKSAMEYGIPRRTLRDRLENQTFSGPSPGARCMFTNEEERKRGQQIWPLPKHESSK